METRLEKEIVDTGNCLEMDCQRRAGVSNVLCSGAQKVPQERTKWQNLLWRPYVLPSLLLHTTDDAAVMLMIIFLEGNFNWSNWVCFLYIFSMFYLMNESSK